MYDMVVIVSSCCVARPEVRYDAETLALNDVRHGSYRIVFSRRFDTILRDRYVARWHLIMKSDSEDIEIVVQWQC